MINLIKKNRKSQGNKKVRNRINSNSNSNNPTEVNETEKFIRYMAPSAIEFKIKESLIGEVYKRYFYLTFPNFLNQEAWLNEILKHPFINVSFYVSKANQERFLRYLKGTMNTLNSIVMQPEVTEYARVEAQDKLKNFKLLQQNLLEGNERMIDFTIIIEVLGRTIEELEENSNVVKGELSNKDLVAKLFTLKQKEAFQSSVPLNMLHKDIFEMSSTNMPTLSASSLFPFSYSKFHESKGVFLGTDQMNGMINVDFGKRGKDRTDSNIVILGKSGTGKSTLIKKLVKSDFARGRKVIILDAEREYKDLCNRLGGLWINCAGGGDNHINPLEVTDLGTDFEESEKKHPLVLQFHKLRNFFKLYIPELKKGLLMDYLEIVLVDVYKEKGINFKLSVEKLNKLKSTDYPIFSDIYNNIIKKKQQSKNDALDEDYKIYNKLEKMFKKTIEGGIDGHLDGYTNIQLDNDFIVLDIHELLDTDKNNLRSEMYNILNFTWKEATKDRTRPANVYVDEYHLLGNKDNPEGLIALKNFVKRFRKYEAGLIAATQNVSDILENSVKEYTEAILNNSTYNFVFGLGDKDLEKLSKLMNLSESEEILLSKKERGKSLFVIGNKRIELEVKISEDELELFGKGGGR